MSKDNKNNQLSGTQLLASDISQAMALIEQSNRHARRRNKLAKRQHRQSVLNYEQAERQYLIEKSKLQPKFRLTVTEFLTCEPDFVNDPEQANEAKYLSDQGVAIEQRVLRFKLETKGGADYMRPSIVVRQLGNTSDHRTLSMTDLIYFVEVAKLDIAESDDCITVFLVYRDKTTLPVIHKYRLTPNHDLALPRWDAVQLDIAYVGSHKDSPRLNNSAACAHFFAARDHL